MSAFPHHHHWRSNTNHCKTECQWPDRAICPLAHVDLPPGAGPVYLDPSLIRSEPSTPSPAKEEPALAQWQAVALIGVALIAVLAFYLFLAYPALRDWTPSWN